MTEHRFGGDWTQEKLDNLKGYLVSYRSIFASNEKAKFFTTWYVDAFAGTGSISLLPQTSSMFSMLDEPMTEQRGFLDGSAKIALGLESPFHKYLFIEESRKRADELSSMVSREFPNLKSRVTIEVEDANKAIRKWCGARDWTKERAVVFLDPYGMQVKWDTVETLAATKAVDLWYLFPCIHRLLTRDGIIDATWRKKLDALLGTSDWESHFYKKVVKQTLFGEDERTERDATVENIQRFIHDRLKTCFADVAPSLVLRNSTESPLFVLCFAAANEKGAPIAIRIARHLLKKGT